MRGLGGGGPSTIWPVAGWRSWRSRPPQRPLLWRTSWLRSTTCRKAKRRRPRGPGGNFLAFAAVKPEVVVTVRPEYEPIYRLPGAFGVGHVEVGSVWEAELRPGVLLVFSNPNRSTFVTDDLRGWPLENVAYSHSTDKFYTNDLPGGVALQRQEGGREGAFSQGPGQPGA